MKVTKESGVKFVEKSLLPSFNEKSEEFRGNLKIKRNDLDSELVRHPEYSYQVSEKYVLAVSKRDEAKEALKQIDAQLGEEFRSGESGKKLTQAAVTDRIELHPDHQKAKARYLRYCREADQWEALKEAFLSRGFVLRDLVALHLSQHYSLGVSSIRDSKLEEVRVAEVRGKLNAARQASNGRRERLGE